MERKALVSRVAAPTRVLAHQANPQAAESLIAGSRGAEALGHTIQAAELYMQAAGEATKKADATRLRRKCQQLIAHAEHLKGELNQGDGDPILHRSSRLHGNDFPAWASEPSDAEFQLPPGAEPFVDDANFSLSPAQEAIFSAWTRPRDLFPSSDDDEDDASFMTPNTTVDLVQDVTTDCSVVAGLSAAVTILTGKQAALASIFYPYDHSAGRPRLSPSGKYIIRLRFNGCERRVVIDDRLPASQSDRTLFVVDRANPRLIWPALVEKAYLKIRGGYDFPGSNSSTDLWVLMGWIPEQVFLQREDFDLDKTWNRIKTAHESNDLVVTLGTGRTSGEEEEIMGLIGEHDYAVQGLDETGGIRRMLVKNPWCNGPVWRGASWSAAQHLVEAGSAPADSDHFESPTTPGSIWVMLEDVVQHFESMYLNWNPRLFPHRQEHHFTWDLPPSYFSSTLVRNPQFSIESRNGGLVWALISRHFVDEELEIARNKAGSMAAVSRRLGFMSILLFDEGGYKVRFNDGAVYRGPYVDSPQTLARFQVAPGRRYTLVLDQQELPLSSYSFTMSLFSTQPLNAQSAEDRMPYVKEQLGAWTRRTAGGNASSPAYFTNPQYKLLVPRATPVSIFLSIDNHECPVHVDMVWAQGKRVISLRERDLVASSGAYQRDWALADAASVDAGSYTIVCSTFEAGQMASFALRVNSAVPVGLEPLPADVAGMLRSPLPAVTLALAGEEKRRAAVSVTRLSRAWVSVRGAGLQALHRSGRTSPLPMVRISVMQGWGPEQNTIATSGHGEFHEPTVALRTPEFDLEPEQTRGEGTWLVLESIGGPGNACKLECEVFSDSQAHIGPWEIL
ncbi:hypothetical protein S40285_00428 [Stachybotrys chlorohalonatus IBT 40285]|uniref:Calpain catalytic domain-containing protein n=1 Tax=Stachybotrys chlorohalonatus (strain IBT 40285) TaxID=1283841 RepID=A0A084QND0_STAC4|nr:hypothetical protein S40285_00428 [Stachybotrys chlorohalonata IBT 40285]